MTPDEHLAHATAVKLMEEKDYFVQIYIEMLRHTMGAINIEGKLNGAGDPTLHALSGSKGVLKAIEIANNWAHEAMKPIHNYGKKE